MIRAGDRTVAQIYEQHRKSKSNKRHKSDLIQKIANLAEEKAVSKQEGNLFYCTHILQSNIFYLILFFSFSPLLKVVKNYEEKIVEIQNFNEQKILRRKELIDSYFEAGLFQNIRFKSLLYEVMIRKNFPSCLPLSSASPFFASYSSINEIFN